jgi:hypothetical protein
VICCYGFPFLCDVRRVVLRVRSGDWSPGFSPRTFLDRFGLSFTSPLVASTHAVFLCVSSVIRSSLSRSMFEVAICCLAWGFSVLTLTILVVGLVGACCVSCPLPTWRSVVVLFMVSLCSYCSAAFAQWWPLLPLFAG